MHVSSLILAAVNVPRYLYNCDGEGSGGGGGGGGGDGEGSDGGGGKEHNERMSVAP